MFMPDVKNRLDRTTSVGTAAFKLGFRVDLRDPIPAGKIRKIRGIRYNEFKQKSSDPQNGGCSRFKNTEHRLSAKPLTLLRTML
jgi:hypothetical protein